MNDLSLLQLARCKGLVSSTAAAASLAIDEPAAEAVFQCFAAQGWAAATPRGWRLTPAGREQAAALIEAERRHFDAPAFAGLYADFCTVNDQLKATVRAWQMRNDVPNDHSDTAYDGAVIAQLAQVHAQLQPVLQQIITVVPRLTHYVRRLKLALDTLQGGDTAYFSRPLIDSYHTVWFELHEDLIALGGLTRAGEAQAGRAQ